MAVKIGMNTSVDIVTSEHKNTLLLPNQAIKKDNLGKNYVEVMNVQQVKMQPVVLGLQDDTRTEIVAGLKEGDKVVTNAIPGKWSLQSK